MQNAGVRPSRYGLSRHGIGNFEVAHWNLGTAQLVEKALQRHDAKLTDAALGSFRERMYGGDFVFSVTRDFVRKCTHPLMVLAGDDLYHPAPISSEIASLAPNA